MFLYCSLLWSRPSSVAMLKKFNYYCTKRRMSMHWYEADSVTMIMILKDVTPKKIPFIFFPPHIRTKSVVRHFMLLPVWETSI